MTVEVSFLTNFVNRKFSNRPRLQEPNKSQLCRNLFGALTDSHRNYLKAQVDKQIDEFSAKYEFDVRKGIPTSDRWILERCDRKLGILNSYAEEKLQSVKYGPFKSSERAAMEQSNAADNVEEEQHQQFSSKYEFNALKGVSTSDSSWIQERCDRKLGINLYAEEKVESADFDPCKSSERAAIEKSSTTAAAKSLSSPRRPGQLKITEFMRKRKNAPCESLSTTKRKRAI